MKLVLAVGVALCIAAGVWPRQVFSHETLTTTVLFDREIVRVLDTHCVMCHSEGGPSFSLSSYEETWLKGRQIRSEVIARHMPPWAAVSGYGAFANDNSLTLRETQFVVSWVEGLGPRNAGRVFLNVQDPGRERPREVRAEPHFGHWQLGTPDITRDVVATPEPIDAVRPSAVPSPVKADLQVGLPVQGDPQPVRRSPGAGGAPRIARAVIDLELKSERRLRALEYMPGDRRAVRAVFFTLERTGQWLGSWTPWYGFVSLPAGVAYRLPPGSRIIAEIHLSASSGSAPERGTLGLFLADAPVRRVVGADLVLDAAERDAGAALRQPSSVRLRANVAGRVRGDGPVRVRADTTLTADTYVLALRPEIRPGLRSIEVSAKTPQGGMQVLLFAKEPPLEWPTPYVLKEPLLLRKGTTLSVTGYFADVAGGQTPRLRLTMSRYH